MVVQKLSRLGLGCILHEARADGVARNGIALQRIVCSRAIRGRAKLRLAEGVRRGAAAQHAERRRETARATRFRRAALFAERPRGTGKKVKGREIDVAPGFCTGPCASKAANHWQAAATRRAPGAQP